MIKGGPLGSTLTNVNTPAPSTAYTAWSQGTCGADENGLRDGGWGSGVVGQGGGLCLENGGCGTDFAGGTLSHCPQPSPDVPKKCQVPTGMPDSLCVQGG